MKKVIFPFFLLLILAAACGGSDENATSESEAPESMVADMPTNDGKGVGEYKEVALNDPLVASLVSRGQSIVDLKCAACHKTTDQRVVGPGFKGITERRKPEWIMNMITNVDVMLEADPTAQALLKECLVRMPNQNLTPDDARAVLEFMFSNDGKPVGQ